LTVFGNNNRKGASAKAGNGLATTLRLGLPMLTRRGLNGGAHARKKLSAITVQDSKNNGNRSALNRNTQPLNAQIGGPLNPEWCEWFMGWPIGWTALQPLATDRFQSWLAAHGKG
jgi:hypothetical protein